jgi:hypothetical protein
MKKLAALFALFLLAGNVFSQEGGIVFSDNGNASFSNDDYFFTILLTDDLENTLTTWSLPDNGGFLNLVAVNSIAANKPLSIFITFATVHEKIDLNYSLKILRPDKTFVPKTWENILIGKGNVSEHLLFKALQVPSITFNRSDRPGTYQFHLTVYNQTEPLCNFVLECNLKG